MQKRQEVTIWTLTSGNMGCEVQVRGVAQKLAERLNGLQAERLDGQEAGQQAERPAGQPAAIIVHKQISLSPPWKWLAPYGPARPYRDLAPPWPDVLLAAGRHVIPSARAIRKAADGKCFTVILQNPRRHPRHFDLIWTPRHDNLHGENVIATLTAPHNLTAAKLQQAARQFAPLIADVPKPYIAALIGGSNRVYPFTDADMKRLATGLQELGRAGMGLLVTTSRRTHPAQETLLQDKLAGLPHYFHSGHDKNADNPYAAFLALADGIIVTADSTNMVGEACFPGVPVYVFHPTGGSKKFRRFHQAMQTQGFTRPFMQHPDEKPAQLIAHARHTDTNKRTGVNSTDKIVDAIYKCL